MSALRAACLSLTIIAACAGSGRAVEACGPEDQPRLIAASCCCGPTAADACRAACREDTRSSGPTVSAVPSTGQPERGAMSPAASPTGLALRLASTPSTAWVPTTSALDPPSKRYLRVCVLRL